MLEEKEKCAGERDEIIKYQRSKGQEIKVLMEDLKEKKGINNTYCEGVAKKLDRKIRRILMEYDYAFECAENIE